MASVFKNSPKWVRRMEVFFAQTDTKKNNYLTIKDFEQWVDNIQKEVDPDSHLIDELRKATCEFWGACGFKPGVRLTKEQFVEKMSEFASLEKARHDEGKDPMIFMIADALYDAADTNHDGFLSLDEYEKVLKASGFDAGTAKIVFDSIDTNHDGKLSRQELKTFNRCFWFTPDGGMFGEKFE